MIKNRETYEIMDPHDVGVTESAIILTARSGRAALAYRAENEGMNLQNFSWMLYTLNFWSTLIEEEVLDNDVHEIIKTSNIGILV